MNVLDLFSGIGGFSLGLERAGMRTLAFCEIDLHARAVLRKHWPNVPCYDDVRTLTKRSLWRDGVTDIDVICGGFPCQDISSAGHGVGIGGERSGLWKEYARIVGEVRPRFVIVENVAALLNRGLDVVLRDLAALGYDAEWHCIPASSIGARHRRDRIWIIADDAERPWSNQPTENKRGSSTSWRPSIASGRLCCHVADPQCGRLQGGDVECTKSATILPAEIGRYCRGNEFGAPWWTEPDVGRVAHGVPGQVDRLKQLGNSVVPQIPEIIGRAIMKAAP